MVYNVSICYAFVLFNLYLNLNCIIFTHPVYKNITADRYINRTTLCHMFHKTVQRLCPYLNPPTLIVSGVLYLLLQKHILQRGRSIFKNRVSVKW